MEAGMMKESNSPGVQSNLQAIRGHATSALVGFALCAITWAQEAPPEPPSLTPLAPIASAPPPKDASAFANMDHAIRRASTVVLAPPGAVIAGDPIRLPLASSTVGPDQISPFPPFFPDVPPTIDKQTKTDHQKKSPGSADEWLAGIRSELENNKKSLAGLDALIRQDPNRAEGYFERGRFRVRLAREGDKAALDAAMADLSRAVELDPKHVAARYWRGWILARGKDRDAALADLSWVIEHRPDLGGPLIERGKVLMNKGQLDRAIADFDRAEGRPGANQTSIWIYRGWCYAAKGQHDRAIAQFSEAIDHSDTPVTWVYEARARSYRATGECEMALSDVDQSVLLHPNDIAIHHLRAEILMELGQHAAVAGEAEQLRKLLPNQPGPYFLHSVASWLDANDRDDDLAAIIQATASTARIFPSAPAPPLIRALATSITGMGRKRALADMDRCLALEPRLSFPYACRAIFNAHEGRFLPTCRDLALFGLGFDRRRYHFFVSIDRKNRRFMIGLFENSPGKEASAKPRESVADLGRKSMDLGFRHLLAATFGSER
jgi:tetratricopeptide (TPR) repeat protein